MDTQLAKMGYKNGRWEKLIYPIPMQPIAFQELALVRSVWAVTVTLPAPYNVLEGRPNVLVTKFLIL